MTAAPALCSGEAQSAPAAEHAWQHASSDEGHSIHIDISPDEELFLDRDPATLTSLGQNLKRALALEPKSSVLLCIDQLVKYGIVATVSDIAFEAGAEKLFFIVARPGARWPDVYGFDCAKPVELTQPTDSPELSLQHGKNQSLEGGINGNIFSSVGELLAVLAEIMQTRPLAGRRFFVKPANDVLYRDVIALMDGASTAGTEYFVLWTPKSSNAFPRPIS